MTKWVAFLRAVNVGGRVVKMDELKDIFALPGITNISSYIQSGNILFETDLSSKTVTEKIEAELLKRLGYAVTVFLMTEKDVKAILKNIPYKDMGDKNLYITMLSGKPDGEAIKLLTPLIHEDEELVFHGTTAYILCPNKTYGNSKLSNSNIEKKLKLKATTRNLATITKITGMLQ